MLTTDLGVFMNVEPHEYYPSYLHMGDCAICGHVRESPIHGVYMTQRRRRKMIRPKPDAHEPHRFMHNIIQNGDCALCGRLRDDKIHIPAIDRDWLMAVQFGRKL